MKAYTSVRLEKKKSDSLTLVSAGTWQGSFTDKSKKGMQRSWSWESSYLLDYQHGDLGTKAQQLLWGGE